MKRRVLERHLREHGCDLRREGAKHTVWSRGDLTATVPRHPEIATFTAYAICAELGIPRPQGR